jgi:hypothetical protein
LGLSEASGRQDAALSALLRNASIAEAAKACGLGESTLYRYLAEPDFKARLSEARKACLGEAIEEIQGAAMIAVQTLTRNMVSGNPAVEVRAAVSVLELAVKARESMELSDRIAQLEAALATVAVRG